MHRDNLGRVFIALIYSNIKILWLTFLEMHMTNLEEYLLPAFF